MIHSEIVSFLWGVADLIHDTFNRGKSTPFAGTSRKTARTTRP